MEFSLEYPRNATELEAAVFSMCRTAEGNAFTVRILMSDYTQFFCKTENGGWQAQTTEGLERLQSATMVVHDTLKKYPAWTAAFPQTVLRDERTEENSSNTARRIVRGEAVLTISEEFATEHSGIGFCKLLETQWKPQMDTLLQKLQKNLLRCEMRTERLFGKDGISYQARIYVEKDSISSDSWTLPYHAAEMYPLLWDNEICGMALCLCKQIPELAKTNTQTVSVTLQREEQQQRCVLVLSIKEETA